MPVNTSPGQLDFLPSQLRLRAAYPDPYTYQGDYQNAGGMEIGGGPIPGTSPEPPPPTAQIENDPRTRVMVPPDATQVKPATPFDFPYGPPKPQPDYSNPDEQYTDPSANAGYTANSPKAKKKLNSRPLSTVANDQFIKFLDTFPQREHPSVSQKIGGVLAAFSQDPKRVDEALYGNYNRQLADWKIKGEVLSQAANLERATNQQILTDEDRDYIAQLRAQDLERRTVEGQQNFGLKSQRLDLDRFKAENQAKALRGGKILVSEDSGLAVWFHNDGTIERISPQDFQDLDFEQKLMMKQAGAMVVLNDKQAFDEQLAKWRQEWEQSNIRLRGDVQEQVNASRPTAANTMSGEEEKDELQLAANEWAKRNPEQASWIKYDATTKLPSLVPPERNMLGLGGPSAEQAKKFTDDFNAFLTNWVAAKRKSKTPPPANPGAIRGEGSSSIRPANPLNLSNYKPVKQVIMIAPDGTEGAVAETEVKRLEGLKYRRK